MYFLYLKSRDEDVAVSEAGGTVTTIVYSLHVTYHVSVMLFSSLVLVTPILEPRVPIDLFPNTRASNKAYLLRTMVRQHGQF